MISIIITGIAGRMGKTILERALDLKNHQIVGATENPKNPAIGQDIGIFAGRPPLQISIVGDLKKIPLKNKKDQTVLIDFTSPKATLFHVEFARSQGLPMVIGTTGFSWDEKKKIGGIAKNLPIVMAPNMSVGVNALFCLVEEAVDLLGSGYDPEVFEAHHRLKKDAPSGTAMELARILAQGSGREFPKDLNMHREGLVGERPDRDIGMQVLRGGDIVGEHTVFFCGQGERLELKHMATSRVPFVDGALRAASWVIRQKPGLYGMRDVLGESQIDAAKYKKSKIQSPKFETNSNVQNSKV